MGRAAATRDRDRSTGFSSGRHGRSPAMQITMSRSPAMHPDFLIGLTTKPAGWPEEKSTRSPANLQCLASHSQLLLHISKSVAPSKIAAHLRIAVRFAVYKYIDVDLRRKPGSVELRAQVPLSTCAASGRETHTHIYETSTLTLTQEFLNRSGKVDGRPSSLQSVRDFFKWTRKICVISLNNGRTRGTRVEFCKETVTIKLDLWE